MDDDAAIGRARRKVDRIKLAQFEDVFGEDRVGVAQPMLDLGDGERDRASLARWFWRGLPQALDRGRAVEAARPAEIFFPPLTHALPALASDGGEPLHKARRHRWRTRELGGARENHFTRAERLRKIVSGERNPPFRQVEPERIAHRAAEPRIGACLRRPDAFHQAAEHDAVGASEPRFERTIDTHPNAGIFRPPHNAAGDGGAEGIGIIAGRHAQACGGGVAGDLVECRGERGAVRSGERGRCFRSRRR